MAFVRKSDSHFGVSGEVSRTGECLSSLGANGVHQENYVTCTPAELQGRTPGELRHACTPAELRAGVHRLGGFAAPMERYTERSVDVLHSLAVMGNTRTVKLPLLNPCGASQGGTRSVMLDLYGPLSMDPSNMSDLPVGIEGMQRLVPWEGVGKELLLETVTAMSGPMNNRYEGYDQISTQ